MLALLLLQASGLTDQVNRALAANQDAEIAALISNPETLKEAREMRGQAGGWSKLTYREFPAPPGWGPGRWGTFSTFQDIEQDSDVVAKIEGGKLGPIVPEQNFGGQRIQAADITARIFPNENRVDVTAELTLKGTPGQAPLFRLNLPYEIKEAWIDEKRALISTSTPREGEILRTAGILIPWTTKRIQKLILRYSGVVKTTGHDKITPEATYVTAWWVPSLGRLPHTNKVTIEGPKEWVLRSEGVSIPNPSGLVARPGFKFESFRCNLPISYPKVIAGPYVLAGESEVNRKKLRVYHLGKADPIRAGKDLQRMSEGMAYFEKHLTPYPFPAYECFDADTYYGIESYSHTLLRTNVTTRFVNHELGHTWFGGVANCPYVEDTWNEGVTQFVDSVMLGRNADRTLETGYRGFGVNVPLSKMAQAWSFGSLSYYRGAYVMNMLRAEIGEEKMWEGLRVLLKENVGKGLKWADLREPMERVSKRDLKWFWSQWIDAAEYPKVDLAAADWSDGKLKILISQSGASRAMRMKMQVKIAGVEKPVDLEVNSLRQEVILPCAAKPESATLVLFPHTLAKEGVLKLDVP